ncbi:UNKNOWN [Stylonychia lemnae]|uniref:Uncharacterized protein n=1 Tax=Stylonychia lemnae TaxID=5949 RepID=A0A078ATN5_STYLE|nr:UNKNOWN [Stylonychia lemnae]|eukprot:CDW85346.1 UNKNOWN [Stylonychia lemnae]
MTFWDLRKKSSVEREMAAQRLDCFLSVVYLFPNCLDPNDMDLLAKREKELSKIFKFSGQGFFVSYVLGVCGLYFLRGRGTPYFRNVVKHTILCVGGTFSAAYGGERLAGELYYNKLLIQLSDKYNFTPEEVLDLQRNLNQFYIRKDRESDLARTQ